MSSNDSLKSKANLLSWRRGSSIDMVSSSHTALQPHFRVLITICYFKDPLIRSRIRFSVTLATGLTTAATRPSPPTPHPTPPTPRFIRMGSTSSPSTINYHTVIRALQINISSRIQNHKGMEWLSMQIIYVYSTQAINIRLSRTRLETCIPNSMCQIYPSYLISVKIISQEIKWINKLCLPPIWLLKNRWGDKQLNLVTFRIKITIQKHWRDRNLAP